MPGNWPGHTPTTKHSMFPWTSWPLAINVALVHAELCTPNWFRFGLLSLFRSFKTLEWRISAPCTGSNVHWKQSTGVCVINGKKNSPPDRVHGFGRSDLAVRPIWSWLDRDWWTERRRPSWSQNSVDNSELLPLNDSNATRRSIRDLWINEKLGREGKKRQKHPGLHNLTFRLHLCVILKNVQPINLANDNNQMRNLGNWAAAAQPQHPN